VKITDLSQVTDKLDHIMFVVSSTPRHERGKSNIFTATTAFIHPNEKRQNEMGIQVYISCHIQIILI
jgi:hypothetical protein